VLQVLLFVRGGSHQTLATGKPGIFVSCIKNIFDDFAHFNEIYFLKRCNCLTIPFILTESLVLLLGTKS